MRIIICTSNEGMRLCIYTYIQKDKIYRDYISYIQEGQTRKMNKSILCEDLHNFCYYH